MEKFKNKWIAVAATAAVVVATLALGIALAFTDLGQAVMDLFKTDTETIEIKSEDMDLRDSAVCSVSVKLHDDFKPGYNKDVYVENTSADDLGNPLIDQKQVIRVRFREFGYTCELDADGNMVEGTVNYFTGSTAAMDPGELTSHTVVNYSPEEEALRKSWPVHTFYQSGSADSTVNVGQEPTDVNDCGNYAHNIFQWVMSGSQKTYYKGTSGSEAGFSADDEPGYTTATAKEGVIVDQTAAAATPVLMSDYAAALSLYNMGLLNTNATLNAVYEKTQAGCWIIDNGSAGDGWCYWSVPLASGEATNLLLDNVATTEVDKDKSNKYAIYVELQAATQDDKEAFVAAANSAYPNSVNLNDGSNASNLMNKLFNKVYVYKEADMIAEGGKKVGETYYLEYKSTVSGNVIGNNMWYPATLVDDGLGTGTYKILELDVNSTTPILNGGNDLNPVTSDDNFTLSGRGAIAWADNLPANYKNTSIAYTIAGANAKYTVSAGDDYKIGTWDDVITDSSDAASLGKYYFSNAVNKDTKVTWLYAGGSAVNQLFLMTEYVYDNTTFRDDISAGNVYAGSNAAAVYAGFAEAAGVTVARSVGVQMQTYPGDEKVYTCTNANHAANRALCNTDSGNCTYDWAKYTTATPTQSANYAKSFGLGVSEIVAAFESDSLGRIYSVAAQAKGAPYALGTPNQYQAGKNYNDTSHKNGAGNTISTTYYWLRSPGVATSRAAYVTSDGGLYATGWVNTGYVGIRPFCVVSLVS